MSTIILMLQFAPLLAAIVAATKLIAAAISQGELPTPQEVTP